MVEGDKVEVGGPSAAGAEGERPNLFKRAWLIDRSFQLKYTALLVVAGTLVSALFGGAMYLAHVKYRSSLILAGGGDLVPRNDSTGLTLLLVTIGMAICLGVVGVVITHRVAGPLFVMSGYVGALARGRYPKMRKLRKGDELQAFFERFYAGVEGMRVREAAEAEAMTGALRTLRDGGGNPAALAVLEAIRQRKLDATDQPDVGPADREEAA